VDKDLESILESVSSYARKKMAQKVWKKGDWVRYAGAFFDENEYSSAVKTLLNGWLVLGQDAISFEEKFPKLVNKKYGVVVNSGSSANLIMVETAKKYFNLPIGTKVITPVAGFPTTLNPILQTQLKPVFVDIELNSLNLDLDQVEQAAKDGAKVIMFAHVLGNPPNLDRLSKIIKDYGLIFLSDECDALGTTYRENHLAEMSDMSSYSFYPAHTITAGEGGFVIVSNKEQENEARSFREWGRRCVCIGEKANLTKCGSCGIRFSHWIKSMPNDIFDHRYVYGNIGYNLKPIDLQCSMLLEQIKKLPEIIQKRKENYKSLFGIFSKYEDYFILPRPTENSDPAWFAFPLTIRDASKFTRFNICNFLEDNKIQTRNYFGGNLLLQPAYEHLAVDFDAKTRFPVATKVTTDTFFLGVSPVICSSQIEYVKEQVDCFMATIK
jgi:CDP-6-deoxy-D-xylo-4-hexulose-3-dehydrase